MSAVYTLGDSVPPDRREEFGALAIGMLDLMVLYDRSMYEFAYFVRDSAIEYGPLDGSRLLGELKRTQDSKKGRAFARLAQGMGVSADWGRFKEAYAAVSGVRNWLAHVTDMTAQPDEAVPTIAWTYSNSDHHRLGVLDHQARINSDILRRRLADAHWVLHHVAWARQVIGLRPGYFGWAELPVPAPSELPRY